MMDSTVVTALAAAEWNLRERESSYKEFDPLKEFSAAGRMELLAMSSIV